MVVLELDMCYTSDLLLLHLGASQDAFYSSNIILLHRQRHILANFITNKVNILLK